MHICDICGGSRFINLPIRHNPATFIVDHDINIIKPSSRRYDCPECVPPVRQGEFKIVEVSITTNPPIERNVQAEYVEHVRRSLLNDMRSYLRNETILNTEHIDKFTNKYTLRLGVVSKEVTERYA